jgi:DNA-binding FadR family transcriptional regulator
VGKKSAHFTVRSKGRLLRVHGTVAQEIGLAIVSGRLKPGEVLDNEIEAANLRKVSRNTYREAMRMLVAKGLVVSRTRTGTRVSEVSEWNVLDPDVLAWTFSGTPRPAVIHALFELRSVVEPAAAALAAARRRPRQLEQMKNALAEMRSRTLKTPEGRMADSAFHAALLESTFNPFVVSLTKGVTGAITALTEFKLRLRRVMRDPVVDHERVYEAIVAKDAPAAREAMNNLIRLAILDMPSKQRPKPPPGAGGSGSSLFALLQSDDRDRGGSD